MLVMGILNVTPDSFSDGGEFNSFESAVAHGLAMITEGADIIDIGGESTRPGALRITEEEELSRVIPVIKELSHHGAVISIDTMRSGVARAAVEVGATYINDVSGGLADSQMHHVVADLGTKYILMHWRGHSIDMNTKATYSDVVAEVKVELMEQVGKALAAGIAKERIILDPGIGFAKESEHNWELIHRITEIVDLGYPVLVGASRKRFLGGDSPSEREVATLKITEDLLATGIWGVRVHSVAPHKEVIARV
jgi:dihydropteroate synthase